CSVWDSTLSTYLF
nr:immunoglobulin light chain junction region [Macaca mulatta]